MATITEHIRASLVRHCGINRLSLPELLETEWSSEFETLMRNRLVMGALRYGRLGVPGKPQFDRVEYIQRKCRKYGETYNLEALVDIANLALVEFVEGDHPNRHFNSLGDGVEHAKVKTNLR